MSLSQEIRVRKVSKEKKNLNVFIFRVINENVCWQLNNMMSS